ncbi:MAG: hypothetical protein AAGF67_14305, partial [Verrucomicrobiota bacterium]
GSAFSQETVRKAETARTAGSEIRISELPRFSPGNQGTTWKRTSSFRKKFRAHPYEEETPLENV